MGVSGIIREEDILPIQKMKLAESMASRVVGGYIAILLGQISLSHSAPGDIDTVAGNGEIGSPVFGSSATSGSLFYPSSVAVDPEGNFYIADDSGRIFRVDKVTGVISHYAGNPGASSIGDGGPATQAKFGRVTGLAFDRFGNLHLADSDLHRIRIIDGEDGLIFTIAGTGAQGFSGDGGPSINAELDRPKDVTVDRFGNIYFTDSNGMRIRKVNGVSAYISTVTGSGTGGSSGDGGPAVDAFVNDVRGIATDHEGNLYLADGRNHRIRRIDVHTGTIDTVAGRSPGDFVENAPALEARLVFPDDVCVDSRGNLFVAEMSRRSVRRIDAITKRATTVTGTGEDSFSGDGGPARYATNRGFSSLDFDSDDNLYLSENNSQRIRMIEKAGGPLPSATSSTPDLIELAALLRKLKKLKKKLKKAKRAGRNSTVRKLKKQIKSLERRL